MLSCSCTVQWWYLPRVAYKNFGIADNLTLHRFFGDKILPLNQTLTLILFLTQPQI